jgi:hypothetical protein
MVKLRASNNLHANSSTPSIVRLVSKMGGWYSFVQDGIVGYGYGMFDGRVAL